MMISAVSLHPVVIPRHNGFQSKHVIVRMETDEGITGYGEMSDFGHLPAYMPNLIDLEKTLNANLAGKNPLHRIELETGMLALFPESNFIYDMSMVIRTGVSLALYDVAGKYYRCSVSKLLGSGNVSGVPIAYPIFRQSTEQDLRNNLQLSEEQIRRGFSAFHVYVGLNPVLEVEFIAELRKAYGNKLQLSVDGSNLLPWSESLKIAKRLEPYHILYYESPAIQNDLEGLANFRRRADLPTSEHIWSMTQAKEVVKRECLDIMNITLTFAGGIERALKLLHISEMFGKSLVVGTTQELSLGSSAQAQFAAVASNCHYPCHITGPLLYARDVTETAIAYRDGHLLIPDGHGLGLDVSLKLLNMFKADLEWGPVSVASVMHRRSV